MNKILKIEELEGVDVKSDPDAKDAVSKMLPEHGKYDGYKVATEHGVIFILIDNQSFCCEWWGYFSTDDELKNYIGANLLDIETTDTALDTRSIDKSDCYFLVEADVQFVTFKTDKGVFQLAVYNAHNGYYGHDIYIFQDDKCLLEGSL